MQPLLTVRMGFFELSRITGDKKYAQVASNALGWMLEHMYYPEEGVCYDLADLKTGEIQKVSPFYKDKKQQVLDDVSARIQKVRLSKMLMNLRKINAFKDAHLLLCNSLIDKQDENGIWMRYIPNHREVSSFHPRFNLWYAESLL